MKIVTLIARILLAVVFGFFGLNDFFNFLKTPPMPPGLATQFATALMESHYMLFVGGVMVISAILFLVNRFVPLALTLLGPVIVNILLFHALLRAEGFQVAAVAAVLWLIVFYAHRSAFAGIFQAKA